MRLAELTLSGFKSFAKSTTLQFPDNVTAVVGPNGSGKSNIAEAIRWVLGEQSMKSLRGKRGEDLIFNGSPKAARLGKASVALTFDNRDGAIPLDFEKVTLGRKIFRDGTNQYFLNDSPVRLKDIVELIARMGLGETKHNLIGQGEVDRFIVSTGRERREFLEEALGLRLFQLKKHEAERKLEHTQENIRQVEGLEREIRPHLRFLKSQADKAEKRESLEKELQEYYRAYIDIESKVISRETERISREKTPAAARLDILEKEINAMSRAMETDQDQTRSRDLTKEKESERGTLAKKYQELQRELGRIEGQLEARRSGRTKTPRRVDAEIVEKHLEPLKRELETALASENIEAIRQKIKEVITRIEILRNDLRITGSSGRAETTPEETLDRSRDELELALKNLEKELEVANRAREAELQKTREREETLRQGFLSLREHEEEASRLRQALQQLAFAQEKLEARKNELAAMIGESGVNPEDRPSSVSSTAGFGTEELRKRIERAKVRLEEIGGIDEATLKEYQTTKSRHEFLTHELGDLAAAAKNLHTLINELDERIEKDFEEGFRQVNREFARYFEIIFGGGKGALTLTALNRQNGVTEEDDEKQSGGEKEYGIDIEVNLPRKRIKGLTMLSGGERALVSVALLFAISAVNPPPFLVLDETDAALDEANSQKYAAILKELSKKTQLVLITHNRETMKQAGVLYGVTMGEDSISKLLSLKLEEAESYGNRR